MDWPRLPPLLVGWALGTILVGAALWLLGGLPALPAELIGLGVAMIIAGVGGLFWLVLAPRRRGGGE